MAILDRADVTAQHSGPVCRSMSSWLMSFISRIAHNLSPTIVLPRLPSAYRINRMVIGRERLFQRGKRARLGTCVDLLEDRSFSFGVNINVRTKLATKWRMAVVAPMPATKARPRRSTTTQKATASATHANRTGNRSDDAISSSDRQRGQQNVREAGIRLAEMAFPQCGQRARPIFILE